MNNLSYSQLLALLICVWLVGMAHILFLPLWEGYDEIAHWSYIQELADTGKQPHTGVNQLSADIQKYAGPMPDAGQRIIQGSVTYHDFSQIGARMLGSGPHHFTEHNGYPNWEAQHPPLFYALEIPIYKATAKLGWKYNLLALRAFAWFLVVLGIAVLVFYPPQVEDSRGGCYSIAAVLSVFVVPEFFPEMARLGNDSLCLLIASMLWVLLMRKETRPSWHRTLWIGALLGAGLLTKAFFVPIGAGAIALRFARLRCAGIVEASLHSFGIAMVAGSIGSWWYIDQVYQTGTFGGGNEIAAAGKLGLLSGLAENFHLVGFIKALFGIAATATWAGTWSFASYHTWILTPLLLLPGLPLVRWIAALKSPTLDDAAPLFFILPMLVGLVYHEFAWIATGHSGPGTPGWYLLILAGPLSFAWAKGWKGTRVEWGFVTLTVCYSLVLWCCQIALFSGTAVPDETNHFPITTRFWEFNNRQLDKLAYPSAASASLTLALVLAGALLWIRWRNRKSDPTSESRDQLLPQ